MKRTKQILAALLAVMMLFSTACSQTSLLTEEIDPTAETTAGQRETAAVTPGDTSGFCVGVGRGDITPEASVPLAGFGNESYRLSTRVLDKLYATCVAVRDEGGETVLLFNLDVIKPVGVVVDQLRKVVSQETGVPVDHILVNCTHTHSGPAMDATEGNIGAWKVLLYKSSRQAASDALADLDACTMMVGTTNTDHLNFVRRYYKENGFVCDNADYGTGAITAHESEIDEEMRVIRFVREGRKDIILANWQCHPHRTGGAAKYDISSDIIGVWREEAEKSGEAVFAYFQGGAGDVNPTSRIEGETRYEGYKDIGRALNEHMQDALNGLTEAATGKVRVANVNLAGTCNHEGEDKLGVSQQIASYWYANDKDAARKLCEQNDISSAFEAMAIIARSKLEETKDIPLMCIAVGDVAFTAAPLEMFCQTEKKLRADSPFSFTFTLGYTNDAQGYMPSATAFPNKGYEVVTCKYVAGTAEQISATQLEMLNQLKNQ